MEERGMSLNIDFSLLNFMNISSSGKLADAGGK